MNRARRPDSESGLTLIEAMIVVAIIGLLMAAAIVAYAQFTKKARAVEADMALAEVTRLEELYFSATGTYSPDLDAIGFKPDPPLKYYKVSVTAVNSLDAHMFQVTASPVSGTGNDPPRLVTRFASSPVPGGKGAESGVAGQSGTKSTATSTGNAGGGSSGSGFTGEGWSYDGIERAESTYKPGSEQRVVDHGKSAGPASK